MMNRKLRIHNFYKISIALLASLFLSLYINAQEIKLYGNGEVLGRIDGGAFIGPGVGLETTLPLMPIL